MTSLFNKINFKRILSRNALKASSLIIFAIFIEPTLSNSIDAIAFGVSSLNDVSETVIGVYNTWSLLPIIFASVIYIFIIISSFNPEPISRTICGLIIAVSIFVDLAFLRIAGSIIHLSDMDLMLNNTGIANDTLTSYSSFMIKPLILSFTFLVIYLIPPTKKEHKRYEIIGYLLPIVASLVGSMIVIGTFDAFSSAIPSFPRNLSNLILAKASPIGHIDINVEVSIPTEKSKIENIVLIVDESISYNYVNSSIDYLDFYKKYEDIMFDFGKAHGGSNCSTNSRSYLRFLLDPKTIISKKALALGMPPVWSYAKAAGYNSYLMGYVPVLLHYTRRKEIEMIDNYIHIELERYHAYFDIELAKKIKEELKKEGKKFFFIGKGGAHFHYENTYPKDKAIFKPHLDISENMLDFEKLINSYKNSVKWATDGFFDELFQDIDLENTVIIYTSDHGQSFGKRANLGIILPITHCSNTDPAYDEFAVPLLVFTKNQDILKKMNKDFTGKPSHFNISPTILELMGYKKGKTASLFDKDLKCYPAFYNDGYGRFGELKIQEFCN